MANLDDLSLIRKIDQSQSLGSIKFLPDQCQTAWQEVKNLYLPKEYRTFSAILFCGMGGSAYGAKIIQSLYGEKIKVPLSLVSDYHLPGHLNENVLVIASSYSGNTEETISCAQEALAAGAKIIGITSGGELEELLRRNLKPVFVFQSSYNPSLQPRFGQGYLVMAQLGILNTLGIISVTDGEINNLVAGLRGHQERLLPDISEKENLAKQYALLLKDKIINLIGGEFLEGAIHAWRNSLNETAKHFANYFILPELNHHLLEGLSFPKEARKDLIFLLIDSSLYRPPIKKRLQLTKEVIEKNGFSTLKLTLTFSSKLGQVFELIELGSFLSFYLTMLHETDPAKIPWVDYFKERMKARLH